MLVKKLKEKRSWTPIEVRQAVVQISDIGLRMPGGMNGPKAMASAWPKFSKQFKAVDHAEREEKVVTARWEISIYEFWEEQVNRLPDEFRRKKIWLYGFIRARRKMTVTEFCKKINKPRRTYDREIINICQIIADRLNREAEARQ